MQGWILPLAPLRWPSVQHMVAAASPTGVDGLNLSLKEAEAMNIFKQTTRQLVLLSCAALFSAMVWAAPQGGGGGGGGGNKPPGHDETQGNNLSFPAVLVDGYTLGEVTDPTFLVKYEGEYPGLSTDDLAKLAGYDWYPQKTEGNAWQAEFLPAGSETVLVSYVDWGDNIEAVNPKVRRPFRLEIQLYKRLAEIAEGMTLTGYDMAVLEYPSSADELQGTNKNTYEGEFATVVSDLWKLRIQYCGDAIPDDLSWNATAAMWESLDPTSSCADVPVSFAVELNVGGKLIFGGSQGGWKPTSAGFYRITFYGPTDSYMSLENAVVGNLSDFSAPVVTTESESDEGDEGAATPEVDGGLNISYVDVEAVGGGGGGGKPTKVKNNPGKKLGHYK